MRPTLPRAPSPYIRILLVPLALPVAAAHVDANVVELPSTPDEGWLPFVVAMLAGHGLRILMVPLLANDFFAGRTPDVEDHDIAPAFAARARRVPTLLALRRLCRGLRFAAPGRGGANFWWLGHS